MNSTTALTFAVIVMTATMPMILLLLYIRLMHSKYRNELWLLRDALVDDVLEGRLARTPGIEVALRTMETHIRVAGRHTLSDLFLAMFMYRNRPVTPVRDEAIGAGVRLADRPRLDRHLNALWLKSAAHLYQSSLPGIFLTPLFRLGLLLGPSQAEQKPARVESHQRARTEIRKAKRQFREKAEPIELGEMPELVQAGGVRNGRGPVLDGY